MCPDVCRPLCVLQTVVEAAGPLEETQAARDAETTIQNTILELLLQASWPLERAHHLRLVCACIIFPE